MNTTNNTQFDELARSIGTVTSRRKALKAFGLGIGALLIGGSTAALAQDADPTPVVVKARKRDITGATQGIPVGLDTAEELGLTIQDSPTGGKLILLPKGSAAIVRLVDWDATGGPVSSISYWDSTPEDFLVGAGWDGVGAHALDAWTSKEHGVSWDSLVADACGQVSADLTGALGQKASVVQVMIPGVYATLADVLYTEDFAPVCQGLPVVGS